MVMVVCVNCGKSASSFSPTCPHCGAQLKQPDSPTESQPAQSTSGRVWSEGEFKALAVLGLVVFAIVLYRVVDGRNDPEPVYSAQAPATPAPAQWQGDFEGTTESFLTSGQVALRMSVSRDSLLFRVTYSDGSGHQCVGKFSAPPAEATAFKLALRLSGCEVQVTGGDGSREFEFGPAGWEVHGAGIYATTLRRATPRY
jgi:hypothetical protein